MAPDEVVSLLDGDSALQRYRPGDLNDLRGAADAIPFPSTEHRYD